VCRLRVRLLDIRANIEEVAGVDDQHLTALRADEEFECSRDRIDGPNGRLSAERFAYFEQEIVASSNSREIDRRSVGRCG
jgi:hypothetical protein